MKTPLSFTPVEVRTASDLKWNIERAGTCEHFFTRSTMKFFGDTMKNFGVRKATVTRSGDGSKVDCWELYRRRAVKHNLRSSFYFCRATFERVHPADV